MRATHSSPHSTHSVIAMLTAAMSLSAQVLLSARHSSQSSFRATVRILLLRTPCHRAHCSLAPRSLLGVTQPPYAYWPCLSKCSAMVAVAGPARASTACVLLGSQSFGKYPELCGPPATALARTPRSERDQYPFALLATAVVGTGFWYRDYLLCPDVRAGPGYSNGSKEDSFKARA